MATRNKIALIRLRRATRPLVKRVPVQAHPDNIAREYNRALQALVKRMHAVTMAKLAPVLAQTRQDAEPVALPFGAITPAIKEARLETSRVINKKRAGLIAQGAGDRVVRFTDNAVGLQVKAVIGVNPVAQLGKLQPTIVDNFAQTNVTLIKSVQTRYLEQVSQVMQESVAIGRRAADIIPLLNERADVAGYNAERIARDQVAKLNALVTEQRHRDLGVPGYFWRTSNDERVRETHQANEGLRFTDDDPPSETGHPGDDVLCRCRREPDLSSFFA